MGKGRFIKGAVDRSLSGSVRTHVMNGQNNRPRGEVERTLQLRGSVDGGKIAKSNLKFSTPRGVSGPQECLGPASHEAEVRAYMWVEYALSVRQKIVFVRNLTALNGRIENKTISLADQSLGGHGGGAAAGVAAARKGQGRKAAHHGVKQSSFHNAV